MAEKMGMGQMKGGTPSPGIGGILLVVAFVCATIGSFLKGPSVSSEVEKSPTENV